MSAGVEEKAPDKVAPKNAAADMDIIILDDEEPPAAVSSAVIDLVGQTPVGDRKCINYQCQCGVDLFTPPLFCLSFYRVKNASNCNQKICRQCYDNACQHYDDLYVAFTEGGNIMEVEYPMRDETFAILDSDSEGEEETESPYKVDPNTLKLLEEEFDSVVEEASRKFGYEAKVDEAIAYLQKGYEANDESYKEVKTMVDSIRKEVDNMVLGFFNKLRVDNHSLPELIIDENVREVKQTAKPAAAPVPAQDVEAPMPPPIDLPTRGTVVKPYLQIGDYYYAQRNSNASSWVKVKLENIVIPGQRINNQEVKQTMYQISRETNQRQTVKRHVTGKELAYSKRPNVLLEVGGRVIALFKEYGDLKVSKRDAFYSGIVGESATQLNKYRYLIFFDDGYANYVHYNNVHLIYECSKDVWDDVGANSRAFIKRYLLEHPNRSMVRFRKNQSVRTEFRGRWYPTTVLNVDCSLVQMYFEAQKRTEWIYRGSRRLDTMYREEQAANRQQKRNHPRAIASANQNKAPYVQYIRDDPDVIFVSNDKEEKKGEQRSVAKKSTKSSAPVSNIINGNPAVTKPFLPMDTTKTEGPPGKIVYYTPRKQNPSTKVFTPHNCSEECQKQMQTTLQRLKGYGPLAKPLLCGFYRLHYKLKNKKSLVTYRTPCGRCVRNMEELHRYLRITKSSLTVDLFNFDFYVRCLAEFILEPNNPVVKDLSQGFEEIQIPVVNYADNELNDFVNYSTQRMPMEGVNLNLDPNFLVGCDCEDDCSDKSKCSCWQLTLQGIKYLNKDPEDIGYKYRRLDEAIFTGIYECNSRCKCAKTCLNRVVQNPLSHKLQVFKTLNRGWGIRCINDIPAGSFICIYAGALLTEQMANEGGKNYGDEYLAELDYIESVENAKEDYEEEAYQSDDASQHSQKTEEEYEEEDDDDEEEEDDERPLKFLRKGGYSNDTDFVASVSSDGDTTIRTRLRYRSDFEKVKSDAGKQAQVQKKPTVIIGDDDTVMISDDEDDREPSSFNPAEVEAPDLLGSKYKCVREMFGKDENVYIMDAKNTGNIGRYLNHSCSPNVFVQNVFVDTHDLRFPWVSFFACNYIRAGTELTWNYNYDIGSVAGKVLYCHCGSADCKGRLL